MAKVLLLMRSFLALRTLCHILSINDVVRKIICWTAAVFQAFIASWRIEMIFHNYTTMFHLWNHLLSTWVVVLAVASLRHTFLLNRLPLPHIVAVFGKTFSSQPSARAINNFSNPRFFPHLRSHYVVTIM